MHKTTADCGQTMAELRKQDIEEVNNRKNRVAFAVSPQERSIVGRVIAQAVIVARLLCEIAGGVWFGSILLGLS